MTILNEDLLKTAKQACLKIKIDDKLFEVKHKIRLLDKSTLGVVFFLFGGLFLTIAPFIKASDNTSKIIGIVLGLIISVLSILTLIKQVSDGLQIKDNLIISRHNLKQSIFPFSDNIQIIMKTEVLKISRVGTLGSEYIYVTHYLFYQNKEIKIFTFHMDNSYAENAKKLGNELTRIIKARIRHNNEIHQIDRKPATYLGHANVWL